MQHTDPIFHGHVSGNNKFIFLGQIQVEHNTQLDIYTCQNHQLLFTVAIPTHYCIQLDKNALKTLLHVNQLQISSA